MLTLMNSSLPPPFPQDSSPQQVIVDIERRDLFFLAFKMQLRSRVQQVFWGILYLYWLWMLWQSGFRPSSPARGIIVAVLLFLLVFTVFLLTILVSSAVTALRATAKAGMLGRHVFEIRPDGLRESTSANETLHQWSGLLGLERQKSYLLIRITPMNFHVLPARAFANPAACDAFYQSLQDHLSAAQQVGARPA